MMAWAKMTMAAVVAVGLSGCITTPMTTQSFPGRTQVQFMSADQVTQRTYACQSTSNAGRAHRYVDGAIIEAQNRFAREMGGGFGASLGVQAEVNAEIARISRNVEAEYRCALLGSRDTRQAALFG